MGPLILKILIAENGSRSDIARIAFGSKKGPGNHSKIFQCGAIQQRAKEIATTPRPSFWTISGQRSVRKLPLCRSDFLNSGRAGRV